MESIIKWLREVEHLAGEVYSLAATRYVDDKKLQKFLAGIIDKVRNLPPVWIEKILIVDDMPIVAKIVMNMLKREGDIDIAENGKTALELIDNKFYKLVISDIDMPVMDGIALFEEAVRRYPKLKNRFLFMTGDLSPDRNSFCNYNNVTCLEKPISVNRLREEAKKIILS